MMGTYSDITEPHNQAVSSGWSRLRLITSSPLSPSGVVTLDMRSRSRRQYWVLRPKGFVTAMFIRFLRRAGRFLSCERAVSTLEYAVLAGVVLAGVGTAIVAFTGDITTAINNLGDTVSGTTAPPPPNLTPSATPTPTP